MIEELEHNGFAIINGIFSESEISEIISIIENKELIGKFGVRSFLKDNPELYSLIYNKALSEIIQQIDPDSFVVRSIYFDKPPASNWIVNWHQDLTINVNQKIEAEDFLNWRVLKDRVVVQPPKRILESIFTVRIHLDPCKSDNGALRVIKGSHAMGVLNVSSGVQEYIHDEVICEVEKGGVLLMKPLALHASRRTENDKPRRIIHIEFCSEQLPKGLSWIEEHHLN